MEMVIFTVLNVMLEAMEVGQEYTGQGAHATPGNSALSTKSRKLTIPKAIKLSKYTLTFNK